VHDSGHPRSVSAYRRTHRRIQLHLIPAYSGWHSKLSHINFQGNSAMKRSIGVLLLCIWLIVGGLAHLIHFSFSGMSTIMAVIAIAAGILIVLGL
jgi:hypothetical protein